MILSMNLPGDLRTRGSISFPQPRGIEENYWCGSGTSFYQRLRLAAEGFEAVLLTEKDQGEEWGDLVTGGISYSPGIGLTAVAGALNVQFAHGLVLSHSGSWGSSDPLSLSKAVSWRMRIENAESPGSADSGPLAGIAAFYSYGKISLAGVIARSDHDPGATGLHRSPAEIQAKGSIEGDLIAFRAGCGPAGFSFASMKEQEDTLLANCSRAGADFLLEGENSVLTGEFSTDFDSIADFLVSVSRGLPELRHGITVSRNMGYMQETSESFAVSHRFGAGYGIRWRPSSHLLVDGGILYLQGETEDRVKAGLQFTENLRNRTELSQRFRLSVSEGEQTLTGRATASWSPDRSITISMKVPFTGYTSTLEADETGFGIEVRLRHRLSDIFEYSLSAAGCSTDGWNSRVYAYSLSFPGEFGSSALYNRTALLQSSVSLHIEGTAVLRIKGSWYCKEGEESLGSGWEETEGSSRTAVGIQLDWNFR